MGVRTGGKGGAAGTLRGEDAKGVGGVWLAQHVCSAQGASLGISAAAAAFIGHIYPIWLRFRGGKGVATLMGIVLALYWPCALVYALVWLGLLALPRISSVAGIAAASIAPLRAAFFSALHSLLLPLAPPLLAVSSARRSPQLPDVPTVSEAGVPGYESITWCGLLAPARTPAAITARLHRQPLTVVHSPALTSQREVPASRAGGRGPPVRCAGRRAPRAPRRWFGDAPATPRSAGGAGGPVGAGWPRGQVWRASRRRVRA